MDDESVDDDRDELRSGRGGESRLEWDLGRIITRNIAIASIACHKVTRVNFQARKSSMQFEYDRSLTPALTVNSFVGNVRRDIGSKEFAIAENDLRGILGSKSSK